MTRRTSDSGTPERAAVAGVLGTIGYWNPQTLIAPAALAALYTRPAQATLRRLIAGGAGPRQAVANRIRTGAQRAAPLAASSDPVRAAVDRALRAAWGG